MLTCQELTELVTDYLEGRLSLRQRIAFALHVGMCRHCRAYLRQMRTTVQALGKVPDEPMPEDVRDALMARFRALHRGAPPAAVPWTARLLAAIDRALGGWRGWGVAGFAVAASVVVLLAQGLKPGALGNGGHCLAMELVFGLVPAGALAGLMAGRHAKGSAGALVGVGLGGSLVALVLLEATCPMRHSAPHALSFHLGGMLFAGLAALTLSRVPALR